MSCHSERAAASACALLLAGSLAASAATTELTPFSAAAPGQAVPAPWTHTAIHGVERRTEYRLVDDDGTSVLRADAQGSASALVHEVSFPAAAAALLEWRWKVNRVLKSGDGTTKEGDDYAARVYVMFDYPLAKLTFADRLRLRLARALYGPDVPAAALCYVWDARLPAGTIIASPYTSRVRIVVVDSGAEHAGRWRVVQRDPGADFRRAYGEEPPGISAVAVATDTDNTGERVTAWYGDIVLKKRGVTPPAR